MKLPEIRNIQDLFPNSMEIIDFSTDFLTRLGENYGSTILSLKIRFRSSTNREEIETLLLVAKMLPPSEFLQKMFNCPVTFPNEIGFYRTIVPTLQDFQRKRGFQTVIECFPKYYSGRLNLDCNPNGPLDNDAILILENLTTSNYITVNRTVGFDKSTAELILKNLAEFHATALAFRTQEPINFTRQFNGLFPEFKIFDFDIEHEKLAIDKWVKIIEDSNSFKTEQVDKVRIVLLKSFDSLKKAKNSTNSECGAFTSIIHTDLWVNNTLVKFDEVTKLPIDNKMVDFQLYEVGSICQDVIFFILTSIQMSVLKLYCLDHFIDYYYNQFVDVLKRLQVPISDQMNREQFKKQLLDDVENTELLHCILMLQPIYADKENIKELEDYKPEDLEKDIPIPSGQIERTVFIVDEVLKRNWI